MNLILSADARWGIGKNNRLLFQAKEDMAFFRRKTLGKIVVMGRKTLESLPGGRPLPQRQNVVLTRNEGFSPEGVVVCVSIPDLLEYLSQYSDDSIMIIGGEQVYRQLLPYCSCAYVTRWDAIADADSFVPDLELLPQWRLVEKSEPMREKELVFRFCTYMQENPVEFRNRHN